MYRNDSEMSAWYNENQAGWFGARKVVVRKNKKQIIEQGKTNTQHTSNFYLTCNTR